MVRILGQHASRLAPTPGIYNVTAAEGDSDIRRERAD
jgi:hypothetical protein